MSRIKLARRAIKLFSSDYVPLHTNKHNRRMWIRSVDFLGSRWKLAEPVPLEALKQQWLMLATIRRVGV